MSKKDPKPERISEPGVRHRRDKGPHFFQVKPVPPPTPDQLGTAHLYTTTILEGGADALIGAETEAQRLAAKFGEEIETSWCLLTPWLESQMRNDPKASVDALPPTPDTQSLKSANPDSPAIPVASNPEIQSSSSGQTQQIRGGPTRGRARATYALQWRPRFLAVVALTRSTMLGARAARIDRTTVQVHRRLDPDFDRQVLEAQEQAVDLLADMTMRTAIEGEAKPIYWQGIRVGHEIVVDNRLRIEMLRAYRPGTFKTPGSGHAAAGATTVNNQNLFVCDKAAIEMIQATRLTDLIGMAKEAGVPIPD